jgi:hypothetical protein
MGARLFFFGRADISYASCPDRVDIDIEPRTAPDIGLGDGVALAGYLSPVGAAG